MIYIITLGFAPPRMLAASHAKMRETIGLSSNEYIHVVVDNHWPKDRHELNSVFHDLYKYGVKVLRPEKNLGLAKGFNYALDSIDLRDDDMVIGYDPDVFPITPGWGKAFQEVLQDKTVGWVSLWNVNTTEELSRKPSGNENINGHEVSVLKEPIMNSVCAWPGKFLLESGGLHEVNPYYGGLECHQWKYLIDNNLKWVFLKEYLEGHHDFDLVDVSYRDYKWLTAHCGEPQIEFSDWLKKRGIL